MKTSQKAAIVTWTYVAGYGAPIVPIVIYMRRNERLPSFFGLFDMMGGPWAERQSPQGLTASLGAYLAVTAVAAHSAWLMWRGQKGGRALNLALLPVEAVFWIGFALPIPWILGAARAALVVASYANHEAPGQRDLAPSD